MSTLVLAMLILAGAIMLNAVALIRASRLLAAICRLVTEAMHDAPSRGGNS